jgi:hypothetical protein
LVGGWALLASRWEGSIGGACVIGLLAAKLILVRDPCKVSKDLLVAADGTIISIAIGGCSVWSWICPERARWLFGSLHS